MAQTPYQDLSSQNILSAHLSGLQHDLNKLQNILNLNTSSVTGHSLTAVSDQDDPSLRYRVYEGSIRNWLTNPAPTIYRNGITVNGSEYTLQAPYGAVVFNEQQNSNDTFTADFDHINNNSQTISNIQSDISTINNDISTIQSNISSNDSDISTAQNNISALQSDVSDLKNAGAYPFPLDPTASPSFMNTLPGYSESDISSATDVLQAADTVDAFPIHVDRDVVITQMKVVLGSNSSVGTMRMGIYTNANAKPQEKLGQTASFTPTSNADNVQSLESNVILTRGVYWVCRYQDFGAYINGHDRSDEGVIKIQNASPVDGSGDVVGVRTSSGVIDNSTGLPTTFPAVDGSNANYLARGTFGTVYAQK